MKISLPIEGSMERYPKGNLIQGFGENVALYQQAVGMPGHNGWDLVKFYGADVRAPHDGIVVSVKFDNAGYGNHVEILSPAENKIYIDSILGHLTDEVLVKAGQEVKMGDLIGKMGNSGFVVSQGVPYWGGSNPDKRGTHTHWTTKRLTDFTPGTYQIYFPQAGKTYTLLNQDNGFLGAFNPLELFGETMTNAYLVKNGQEYALALPATTPDGLISQLRNVGVQPPLKPDGTLDFDKLTEVIKVIVL